MHSNSELHPTRSRSVSLPSLPDTYCVSHQSQANTEIEGFFATSVLTSLSIQDAVVVERTAQSYIGEKRQS